MSNQIFFKKDSFGKGSKEKEHAHKSFLESKKDKQRKATFLTKSEARIVMWEKFD